VTGGPNPDRAPPRTAMLLAAGLGTRMRPLTAETAKPLLPLMGRPLLDHALDRLGAAGVERVVVNAHWHAERIAAHLTARSKASRPPEARLRREDMLLDTGGGVRVALAEGLLGPGPFYVLNGDAFWLDGPTPALTRLAGALDPAEADAMLLLHRAFQVHADVGSGDFALDPWGMPRRPEEHELVPYIFAGLQIVTPALFAPVAGLAPDQPFSMNLVWDRALAAGRLRARVHDGMWFHLSTPADLAQAEFVLGARAAVPTS